MAKNIGSACLLSLALCSSANALEWEVYKFAEFGFTGTDNFRQNRLDADITDELVGSIKPSIELDFTGNRFEGQIIGEVELLGFNNEEYEVVDPRLLISVGGTLVENLFYFDANLDHAKALPGDDLLDLNEDSDSLTRLRFTPFIARSFGRAADLYIGYGLQSTDNETDGEVDSQQDTVEFSIGRNPRYGGFIWGLGGAYDRDDFVTGSSDNSSVYASIGQTIGDTVYFELLGGQEFNSFDDDLNLDDETVIWNASMTWTPSERTELQIGYGDRFFGEGPTFSFEHRVRNSFFNARFSRDITSSEVSLGSLSPFSGTDTGLVPGVSGDLVDTDGISTRNRPFLEKRFQLGYKLAGRRSDLVIDAAYSEQEQLSSNNTREQLLGRLAFDRHLSPLTTFRLQYEARVEDDSVIEGTATENRLGFKFIYNFDRKERVRIVEEDS